MFERFLRFIPSCLALILGIGVTFSSGAFAAENNPSVRETVVNAITASGSAQQEIILTLLEAPTPEAVSLLTQWRSGEIFLHTAGDGSIIPILPASGSVTPGAIPAVKLLDGSPLTGPDGEPLLIDFRKLDFADTSSPIRRAMKEVTDLAALAHPDPARRLRAVQDSSIGQNAEKLPGLQLLKKSETNPRILRALDESIAIIQLRSTDRAERIAACKTAGDLASLRAQDAVRAVLREATEADDQETIRASSEAIRKIEAHISTINAIGTTFRGLSLGSVLLVVAIGLAITFGLMGIINMAHGEFIAVGAYTTYVVQNCFAAGLKLSPFGFSLSIPGLSLGETGMNLYFLAAIPASFLVAALVGILLERSVIQFLYKRPLESLLATWGISLVMQQILKFVFGANNVQVSSPSWLSGNWTVNDIVFGWNRVFVIGFAVLIIVATWLVLNKTSLGLLIRAVMQNRNMAACMGVRTERVNTLTFAFGCGLAGLAGAFLSQIGNVGPSLGQTYIVDSFMTVVVGGVGNILGTVISALGIGMADQTFQQYLGNPVIGKILVLGFIILFLQWRPSGLFATRPRSLD